jgi:flagellar hook-associated protein 3 FlgL
LVTAALSQFGNGIELTTTDASVAAPFAVLKIFDSQAAEDLGLVPVGQNQSNPATVGPGVETITGRDVNPREVKGVFNALIRLRDALLEEDVLQIDRSIELLDDAALGLNFARAELGARQQALDVLQVRQDDERVNLDEALSLEIDADFVEVVSELTSRQTAYQANLQLAGRTLQLTLLDYL